MERNYARQLINTNLNSEKMKTAKKTNIALVEFSDGRRHKYSSTATIPEIRKNFYLGRAFHTDDEILQITVEAVTIS